MFGVSIWAIPGWVREMSEWNGCYGVYVSVVFECVLLW